MTDHYFFTMIGSMLGWLDISIPHIYCTFIFILFLVAVNIHDEGDEISPIKLASKMWTCILCISSILLTMLAMLLDWTPSSFDYILGVQGRYFIPLLIPAIILFKNHHISVERSGRKHILFCSTLLNIWICIYVFANSLINT